MSVCSERGKFGICPVYEPGISQGGLKIDPRKKDQQLKSKSCMRKGKAKDGKGKKNNILSQNKGFCQEIMSHFLPQDQETLQKIPGLRFWSAIIIRTDYGYVDWC